VKDKADRQYAAWRAEKAITQLKLTKPPVLSIDVAHAQGIFVRASDRIGEGFSGCLMKSGSTFGILYSSRIDNQGFIHFTVAHELGHYFMETHQKKFFGDGETTHYSQSGFVSYDPFEVEADHFAAAFLMPQKLFKDALGNVGEGIAAIDTLHHLFTTSLTATAIRFAELTPDPVAIVVSEANRISYMFSSTCILHIDGVRMPEKGTLLPPNSETAQFNRDPENIKKARKAVGYSQLDD
jgi:hypothetical protein